MLYFSYANLAPREIGWNYSDFKTGAVKVWGQGTVTVDLIEVKNTQSNWQKVQATNKNCMCRIYAVDLSGNADPDSFVENLQYFFIRADRVANPGLDSPQLGLLVQGTISDVVRARAYLSMVSGNGAKYNLLYRVVEKEDKANKEKGDTDEENPSYCCPIYNPRTSDATKKKKLPGRFMPLMRVVSPEQEQRPGALYPGEVSLSTLCSTAEQDSVSSGSKLTAQELKLCHQTYSSALEIPWQNSVKELCLLYWYRTLDKVVGTNDDRLNTSKKEALREQLTDFVLKRRKHMSLLAELYWFFILSNMMSDKMLIQQTNEKTELDTYALLQSYLDTLNYTDGILQLMENSCQHTFRKYCYVSMRVLYVKRDVPDQQLIQNMRARETLMNRYSSLSMCPQTLDTQASYYVDVSIVDDARISASKVKGLLQVYRKNAKARYELSEERLPKTLEDVFSDDRLLIDTPDGLVHHYGLDSLKQVISKNGGMFLVSSPDTDVNPDSKHTEVVLYPIPSDPKKKPLPRLGLDDTTEYHILYPLRSHSRLPSEVAEKDAPPNTSTPCPFESKDIPNSNINTAKFTFYSFFPDEKNLLYLNQESKIDRVNQAVTQFRQQIPEDNLGRTLTNTELENLIFLFDIRGINSLELELFAKFIFRLIADKDRAKSRRLFAIYFDNHTKQQEFIRLFAIFYRRVRQMETRDIFSGAQIALCSTHIISEKPLLQIPEVNLILNAKNWNSLFESARQFAYCNLESAQKVISQIRYFSGCDINCSTSKEDSSLFPFDLYLKDNMDILPPPHHPFQLLKQVNAGSCSVLRTICKWICRGTTSD